jgi:diaminopimelate decarboxylase/aspartate kinase
LAQIGSVSAFFTRHALLMLSQSANDLCLSMLVHTKHAHELLKTLHDAVIGNSLDEKPRAEVFGPSWQELLGAVSPTPPPNK